jgi:hypothetical protein
MRRVITMKRAMMMAVVLAGLAGAARADLKFDLRLDGKAVPVDRIDLDKAGLSASGELRPGIVKVWTLGEGPASFKSWARSRKQGKQLSFASHFEGVGLIAACVVDNPKVWGFAVGTGETRYEIHHAGGRCLIPKKHK